jgi:RNA polymerase sigma-70 factor (ECF subfamily)
MTLVLTRDRSRLSPMGPTDEALVHAVAGGDRAALRALYERHAPWLVIRLRRRCADGDAVDDAVQDTFVAVWRSAASYGGSGEVGAWIWGIAIRRLVDAVRRRPRREFAFSEGRRDEPSAEDEVLALQPGALGDAVDRLSPDLRAVVQATVLDGLTCREAALLLNIPAGTVKTRMMRARAQLQGDYA